MSEYQKHAEDFLQKSGATCLIEARGCARNKLWKDTEDRNVYNVTLATPKGSMSFLFWDSIYNTRITHMTAEGDHDQKELAAKKAEARPTAYDILACLTKYDPGTFEQFCTEYGYDEDSRTAERIYLAVVKEYKQLERIFTEEQMEELREIN